ncbi:DNA methyltransferase [Nitrosomonas sp. Nm33]|uniref:class I SAM-dependent DNA methyltransferase n=1 Tax=Nitrosomonas sp. Nm33 TaxID=133724 RepID=UPI0008967D8D|nr:DNA methyltransferase [Nitrosomonas sp. Nm33]SDY78119.1 Type II restriction/modification system, DNA methylase subunit YeeA [Nitrosomonas sp. Nm33]
MTPEKFIKRWTENDLTEKAGAQPFIEDLCELLQIEKPRHSEDYCYEKGAIKDGGGQGWADVWKRDHFGWENKKPGSDLKAALAQLREYSGNLGNPPLLIVCDREHIEIHTAFRGYPDEPRTILLKDIGEPVNLQILRWVFTNPDKLKPLKSNAAITTEAAGQFAKLAKAMRERGVDPQQAAHFLTQCIFCMFAEDEGLLHDSPTSDSEIFSGILKAANADPSKAADRIKKLFAAMQKKGGIYGNDDIAWFNGGLFKIIDVPPLTEGDLSILRQAAESLDWRAIDPTIFGTLFERGLDPNSRAQLGAHYTDVATINKLIEPLITRPLSAEWIAVKTEIIAALENADRTKGETKKKYRKAAIDLYHGYLERLRNFRVLDAACGSGNFLYLALHALKDLEHIAQLDAEALGLSKQLTIETGTDNVLGIETNEYAAELARVTVWIGDIQWCQRNGRPINKNPILSSLDGIQHRDALLNVDGSEALWPQADVIIGNPPFLGDKVMRGELGDDYVTTLRNCYKGRVPGGADLVCYWFDKARQQIANGKAKAAGLVSTNSIRQKRNRVVLESILQSMPIFEAWPDEDWFDAGTAVRVSLVCFGYPGLYTIRLAGKPVALIHADLTASSDASTALDLTQAKSLPTNKDRSFFGLCLAGPFKVDIATALAWLKDTGNPNGRPNSDVVRPIYNGSDITRRWAGNWVVDFAGMEQEKAADYLAPFAHVEEKVKPVREGNREAVRAEKWWRHGRRRPELRAALTGLTYYIATPETAKHRFFVKFPVQVAPEHSLIVFPREDDVILGILSSRIHCIWALAKGGRMGLGNEPRYNASLTFETFPFPPGFDLKVKAILKAIPENMHFKNIAEAAADLTAWRDKWLNPEGWLEWAQTEEERAAGFPPRPIPKLEHAVDWKKRTLTNLYNEMPTGLKLRCEKLDKAVAKAYGWNDYTPEMTDTEILQRLLKLNLLRTTDKQSSTTAENSDEHKQQCQEIEALPIELQQQASG